MSPDRLVSILIAKGCTRVLAKRLSANDNSKNQIYLGGDFTTLNLIPFGQLQQDPAVPGNSKRARLKAEVALAWVDESGASETATGANLILYPKYPEVRLSGMLERLKNRQPTSVISTRHPSRWLFLAVSADGTVFAYACLPGSDCAGWAESLAASAATHGVFHVFELLGTPAAERIGSALRRIATRGWIRSRRLDGAGASHPCEAENCGGYTLEAELGIRPNGRADPDYDGWEVKQFAVRDLDKPTGSAITLFTPEPDGGVYRDAGVEVFLERYGHDSLKGVAGRIDFGGVHRVGICHVRTGLTLRLVGWDHGSNSLSSMEGGIHLVDSAEVPAATWSFTSLVNHWKRKHSHAVYVPSEMKSPPRQYRYGAVVFAGLGTDFLLLLSALADGAVYYDPGIKLERVTGGTRVKRRSQFRIHFKHLQKLYRSAGWRDLRVHEDLDIKP